MSRITGSEVYGLMEAYNAVYSPQINEDYIWESCLTEEFISEAYQTVADYLVHNGFVPGYNTAEVYMSEMAVEDIDSILFETGVLNEQYLIEAGFFQGLGAGADKFVSGAKKNIQGAASNVQRVGQTAVGGAQRLGTAAVGAVKADIGNKIKAGQAVVGGAQRLGTAAVGAVKADIGNKIKAGQAVVGGAQRLGTAAVGAVKADIGNKIKAGQAVVGGAQRAAGAVQKAVTPVAQAVQGTAQRAVSAGQSALGSAGKAIQGTGQAIAGVAQRAAGAVAGASKAVTNKIGQEVEISRKVGAGEPLGGSSSPTAKSTPSRFAGARDKAFSAAQGIKGSPVVGPKTATPAPGARPATPAPSMAKPATPAAKPATPAAMTGNPPLRPPALPPITGKPSLKSGIDDLKKMGDASRQRQASMLNQSFDPFDYILEYLVAEGYADTNEAAISIMANMSEEWRVSIVEEVLDEGDNYDKNRKRAAQRAAARNAARDAGKTGAVPGVGYVTPRRERETYTDAAGTERHKTGARMPEKKD
jgi:hypothetical protein